MKKKILNFCIALFSIALLQGCSSRQDTEDEVKAKAEAEAEAKAKACDCVEQFNYSHQDWGMDKIDMKKYRDCIEKYKDNNANDVTEYINSAEKNCRSKCK